MGRRIMILLTLGILMWQAGCKSHKHAAESGVRQDKNGPVVGRDALRRTDSAYHRAMWGKGEGPDALRLRGYVKSGDMRMPIRLYIRRGEELHLETGAPELKTLLKIHGGVLTVPDSLPPAVQNFLLKLTYRPLFPLWEYALDHPQKLHRDGRERVNGRWARKFVWFSDGRQFDFYLGEKHHYLIRVDIRPPGKPTVRVDFADFRPAGSHKRMFPRQWIVQDPGGKIRYQIFWHDIRFY